MVERGIAVTAIILRSVVRPSVAASFLKFLLEALCCGAAGSSLARLPNVSKDTIAGHEHMQTSSVFDGRSHLKIRMLAGITSLQLKGGKGGRHDADTGRVRRPCSRCLEAMR